MKGKAGSGLGVDIQLAQQVIQEGRIKTLKKLTLEEAVPDQGLRRTMEEWLAGGCQVAVYENHDLGSLGLGRRKYLKVGPGCSYQAAPERLPDTPEEINWRYTLIGIIIKR